jgi:hypothetical protein
MRLRRWVNQIMGLSIEEFKKLKVKKKNKYGNKKVVIDDIPFDSTKEGAYYEKLKLAKKSGELINFYMQVPFRLPGKTTYWLDFLEIWKNALIRHVDVKAVETSVFKIKKRQVEEIYNIKIEVV